MLNKYSKPVKVPVVLVASSSKAKKRRKGGIPFSDVELIVDPTSDECSTEQEQHRSLYSLPTPPQVLPGFKSLPAP